MGEYYCVAIITIVDNDSIVTVIANDIYFHHRNKLSVSPGEAIVTRGTVIPRCHAAGGWIDVTALYLIARLASWSRF